MLPFILSFIAGFSTLVGFLFIYLRKSDNVICSSLSFSSGVMFLISIYDLLPESFNILSNYYSLFILLSIMIACFLIGFIGSFILDSVLPDNKGLDLYKVGLVTLIALVVHNIPEGIITYMTTSYDTKMGLILAISIGLHNIPEGISISMPIYYSTGSKIKSFFYTFVSGFSEFVGAFIGWLFFRNNFNIFYMACLYSVIAGIMIYISMFELLLTSLKYKRGIITLVSFLLGCLIMYISIILLH